jgi:hypothetical protein
VLPSEVTCLQRASDGYMDRSGLRNPQGCVCVCVAIWFLAGEGAGYAVPAGTCCGLHAVHIRRLYAGVTAFGGGKGEGLVLFCCCEGGWGVRAVVAEQGGIQHGALRRQLSITL